MATQDFRPPTAGLPHCALNEQSNCLYQFDNFHTRRNCYFFLGFVYVLDLQLGQQSGFIPSVANFKLNQVCRHFLQSQFDILMYLYYPNNNVVSRKIFYTTSHVVFFVPYFGFIIYPQGRISGVSRMQPLGFHSSVILPDT